jgi:SAM-dependent methyltransferase
VSDRLVFRNALWAGFGVRLIIALWNGFFGPSFGGEGDGVGLHQLAVDFANGRPPDDFRLSLSYIYALGAFYWLVTPSAFLGSLLSCFVWLASALAMVGSMRIVGAGMGSRARAVIIYGLVPSSILWTSITMREPYQLLAVNLAIYASLRILIDKSWWHWPLLFAAVAIGALTHAALLAWGVCLVAAVVGLRMSGVVGRSPVRLALAVVTLAIVVFAGYRLFTQLYSYPLERGLAFAVNSYQQGGLTIGVRTDYRTSIALSSTRDLLVFIPTALGQYLFEPMPWRVSALGDLVALLENLLRLGLIVQAVFVILGLRGQPRGMAIFAFMAFLVLETAWALGTFNWGTAARHHIPSYGLLLLTAYARPAPSPRAGTNHGSDGRSLHAAAWTAPSGANVDPKTVEGFGDEWTRFDQSEVLDSERDRIFAMYFGIFPWERLPAGAEGFDLGCGSGRWARLVAPRVGRLHCIDPSAAIEVARRNLAGQPNCEFHRATVDAIPLADGSMDFGYSLGVLHHVPDTEAGILACVSKLKPGAPFLTYIYYAFDNRPWWFYPLWRMSYLLRGVVSRMPSELRYWTCMLLAAIVYWPLARMALLLEKLGVPVANFPLAAYRWRTFYNMRTDALDRFGTHLEQRFSRAEITAMMERSGLEHIVFSPAVPYWTAVGYKRRDAR